jgi:hypothetical protein
MSVITLTTDRKANDFFLARVKGQLLRDCPDVSVVDISHDIEPFNIAEAAFKIKYSSPHFPDKTIHLIGVDSEKHENQNHLAAEYRNQYFIAADNGIFSLIFDEMPAKLIIPEFNESESVKPALLCFVEIAQKIVSGMSFDKIGKSVSEFKRKITAEPVCEADLILGKVIYIDSYKNVISNISHSVFEQIGRGRRFKIFIGSNRNTISRISRLYADSEHGELAALFNSLGFLEIAVVRGKVAELLNFTTQTQIRINFYD